jgi:hypothetical protein
MYSVYSRIGINEEQIFPLRSACTCISRRRDLASIDSDDFRARMRGDLRRRVR